MSLNPDTVVIGGYAFIGAVVIAVLHSCTGCAPRRDAEFAHDVGLCELEPTCAGAVLCRKAVAEKYGRPFTGHCEFSDGGSDR